MRTCGSPPRVGDGSRLAAGRDATRGPAPGATAVGSAPMGDTGSVRIIRHDDVDAALDMTSCIEAVERALTAYSAGRAELPAVIQLDVPEHGGEIHIKAGHLHGEPAYAVKIVSGFPANPERGLPDRKSTRLNSSHQIIS